MSAVGLQEASMVIAGTQGTSVLWNSLDAFIARSIEIVPFDEVQARLARDAFLRYGKGRHPAALNLGDCAAYALAAMRGLPLLFKGADFRHTDIVPALPNSNAHCVWASRPVPVCCSAA